MVLNHFSDELMPFTHPISQRQLIQKITQE